MLRWHRPLMLFAGTMAVLAVATTAAWIVDDRTLDGMPIWAKPTKFAISFVLYSFTWAWLLSLSPRGRRWSGWAGTVLAVAGLTEVVLIVFQAARVERSHFNFATPLDTTIYMIMASTITALMVANIVAAVAVLIDRPGDRPLAWSLWSGLIISTLGLASGILMTMPTAGQDPAFGIVGAHTVGVPDGGPGLPALGWSTVGGDLRVPHFVGMHALQLLPLLALALTALAGRVPALRHEVVRARLVAIGGGLYGGVFALTVWQALRGQSVVKPDGLTLAVLAALLVAALTAVLATALAAARLPRTDPAEERSAS
ncbi:hypothetical protein HII36_30885 [Nonomuraea sp. NN258]|uniref:hypothetical protein n=1 Tax=Nonomuraea antri TaxID=2730852 RepID=UPI001568438C|nr:hypothetical protein [Nonomuraea antri]NRQ36209.1 hypothetical protein [Nonomuraea antri]